MKQENDRECENMLNRENCKKQIVQNLALLSQEIKLLSSINLYDINIVAEDFYSKLLNLIYGYDLKNINHVEKNAAAIDLFDKKNRISIQVTCDNDSQKIHHTIEKFISHKCYEDYDRLVILILTEKKHYSADFDTKGKFLFDKKEDIWDTQDIIQYVNTLDTRRLEDINEFLQLELSDKCNEAKRTQASEIDTIIDLIEYISKHKEVKRTIDPVIDPDYKIYKRFREFADKLINDYQRLYILYNSALDIVNETLGIDEAQEIIIMLFLQDISIKFLDEAHDDPVMALDRMVEYFDDKLSKNGKRYDRAAVKFYLINEMIKCNVFPNERSEYNGSE